MMKFRWLIVLCWLPLAAISSGGQTGVGGRLFPLKGRLPATFDLAGVMRSLYGEYDPATRVSISTTPPSAADQSSFFAQAVKVYVRPFFASSVSEEGTTKLFLVTYAVPASGTTFDCHACAPLIDAFAFSKIGEHWQLTAASKGVIVLGQWGGPPEASLIKLGPRRYGVKLTNSCLGQGETTVVMALLVPWDKAFGASLKRWMADDDAGECGDGMLPCYSNAKNMQFVKGRNRQYYDIVFTLSGTEMTETHPYKTHRVEGVERLEFSGGKYVSLYRTGDIPVFERAASSSPFYK